MNYNKIDKKTAKGLNLKQTVLIETVVENNKTSINVYMNNSRKRSEAFYEMYKDAFKPSKKKDEVQKSYRLLKFQKALDEIGNKGAKEGVSFYQSETYKADPTPKEKVKETPAEETGEDAVEETTEA